MYYSGKRWGHELGLSACFRQWRAQSHCRFLHGYPLAFEAQFRARTLDANNWVQDFGSLKPVKSWLEQTFDHKTIVAEDDPEMALFLIMKDHQLSDLMTLPTTGCEGFAEFVYNFIDGWLREQASSFDKRSGFAVQRVHLDWIKCQEHGGNWAIYDRSRA